MKYSCKVQRELSIEMMDAYMKRGYVFFLNIGTDEHLRGMQGSIVNTHNALYYCFRLFAEILPIAFICLYVMISDIVMAICICILVLLCLLITVFGFQQWIKRCGK